MLTIEYRDIINKSAWPRGLWDNEPDKRQWRDEATGLPCMVRRARLGHWCGYVGVPPGHPLHGKAGDELEAHGGITYRGRCDGDDEAKAICHVPEPGEPDEVWWFGFDCGHAWDMSPGLAVVMPAYLEMNDCEYRVLAYVESQCRQLAKQIAKEQP